MKEILTRNQFNVMLYIRYHSTCENQKKLLQRGMYRDHLPLTLVRILPVGVVSKKDMGARKILSNIF